MLKKVERRVHLGFVPQAGPQTAYIHSPFDITVMGGARGGGKTHGSLGDFWIHAEQYGQRAVGLMIRKTREDLKDTIRTGRLMYGAAAKYFKSGNYFLFSNGAILYCAYLENEDDAQHYQGWSLTRVYVEELTQFHGPEAVLLLLGTLRSV
jgi:phage terminase large subunit-like protein